MTNLSAGRTVCMGRRILVLAALVAGLGLAWLAASSGDDDNGGPSEVSTVRTEKPVCRAPLVTALKARWGGERGLRLKLRVNARARNGRVIALNPSWGDGVSGVHDLIARRRISLELAHR